MWKRLALAATAVGAALAVPSHAALKPGARAPAVVTDAALGGRAFRFSLADALRRGPVVLYFYPKAFTKGCTLEARAFAEATDDFRRAGATVIGLSADDIGTLKRFSVEECRSAFPVGVASPAVISAYDVKLPAVGLSNRTSFVIGRDGRIAYTYSALSHKDHVANTLAAVQRLRRV